MRTRHAVVLAAVLVALLAARLLVSRHGGGTARDLAEAGVGRVLAQ